MNESKIVLITGASSGIGYELAKKFAKEKYSLILIASNEEKLELVSKELKEKYDIFVKTLCKDLTKRSSAQEIFEELKKNSINVNILVNNAGFGVFGEFNATNIDEEIRMIQLNISALTYLTKLFVPYMISKNDGKILNVASLDAFFPGPYKAVYNATKSYVLSFSEALNEELKDTGVNVSVLCPGLTKTNFHERANANGYSLNGSKIMDAEKLAEYTYKEMIKGKKIIVPGFSNKLKTSTSRILPRSLLIKPISNVQKNKE